MATLRDIKRKIDAVKKTQQITRAMNMVAASKLRTTQQQLDQFVPYATQLTEIMNRVAAGVEPEGFPLLMAHEEVVKVELISLTADRGLCGAFNTNLIAAADKFIQGKEQEGLELSLTQLGRKGRDYFRRRKRPLRVFHEGMLNKPNYADASALGQEVIDLFLSHEVDEVYVCYAEFINIVTQRPVIKKLLPIAPETMEEEGQEQELLEYIFEPSREGVLNDLLPNYINLQLLEVFFQTAVSEHAARMAAMDNAVNNCKEMVRDLTLVYNKARQAAITAELMDIVGGVEALKK
ncbi:MAG: ATP synthase F1 subunit gamma [Deltaproteobacteria bacterium]|nr:ATP synthase F1 subunit gamma [Deltaproteobacteria bacterium]MDH3951016.1 ATP synthase F1 subunit gamma [Deltaproteobacteria bacterium]